MDTLHKLDTLAPAEEWQGIHLNFKSLYFAFLKEKSMYFAFLKEKALK